MSPGWHLAYSTALTPLTPRQEQVVTATTAAPEAWVDLDTGLQDLLDPAGCSSRRSVELRQWRSRLLSG